MLIRTQAQIYKNSAAAYTDKIKILEDENKHLRNEMDDMSKKAQEEFDALNNSLQKKDEQINKLERDLTAENREKNFYKSKAVFLDKNGGSLETKCLEATSSAPNFDTDRFDDDFFQPRISNVSSFFDSGICQSEIFQQRNSQYLPHLKSSYAIGEIDKPLSEFDIKVSCLISF